MLRKNSGVTMVMLVITVIVMLVLAGIVINKGISMVKSARNQSIYTNLLLIQAKARTMVDKDYSEENAYIGQKITDSSLLNKLNIKENNNVYILSQEELYQMGVEVSGNNIYAVDYDNEEVYYIKGIEDKDKNMHYSLTDISSLDIIIQEK